ncbi:hypothetical protein [Intestinibacter sp.]|uniref:hypothetical protein n=1 Tax=Intestinibacter sp. TaxID=1965304 RepID=UPI003F18ED34
MTLARKLVETLNSFEEELRANEKSIKLQLDCANELIDKVIRVLKDKSTQDYEKVILLKYLLC